MEQINQNSKADIVIPILTAYLVKEVVLDLVRSDI